MSAASKPFSAPFRGPALRLLTMSVVVFLAPIAARAQLNDEQRIRVAERLKESTVTVIAGDSTGSGFLVPTRGWIVTNAHVASGARWSNRLRVRFGDGSTHEARLLAYDAQHDLAIAEVAGDVTRKPLVLGDSDAVKVGQTVLAFGSPFGLEGTLTQGIVSARRDLGAIGAGDLRGVIQTDAPINPGNSGGPLVNASGEVVGVNTAILSRSGSSAGIGFAVPSSYVKELLAALEREVSARAAPPRAEPRGQQAPRSQQAPAARIPQEPWLGLLGRDYRGHGYRGVQVSQVAADSPAARAGILGAADQPPPFIAQLGVPWTGHIILAVDSHPVRNMNELKNLLSRHQPGDEALITVTVGPGVLTGETVVRLEAAPRREGPR